MGDGAPPGPDGGSSINVTGCHEYLAMLSATHVVPTGSAVLGGIPFPVYFRESKHYVTGITQGCLQHTCLGVRDSQSL